MMDGKSIDIDLSTQVQIVQINELLFSNFIIFVRLYQIGGGEVVGECKFNLFYHCKEMLNLCKLSSVINIEHRMSVS